MCVLSCLFIFFNLHFSPRISNSPLKTCAITHFYRLQYYRRYAHGIFALFHLPDYFKILKVIWILNIEILNSRYEKKEQFTAFFRYFNFKIRK